MDFRETEMDFETLMSDYEEDLYSSPAPLLSPLQSPTRSTLQSLTPSLPQSPTQSSMRTLPDEETAALSPNCGSASPLMKTSSPQSKSRAQLNFVDESIKSLQKLQEELRENLFQSTEQKLCEKAAELEEIRRENCYLKTQLMTYTAQLSMYECPPPSRVGDLQCIPSSRAYILYPNVGRTAVFALSPGDVDFLNLPDRSEALSCDPL